MRGGKKVLVPAGRRWVLREEDEGNFPEVQILYIPLPPGQEVGIGGRWEGAVAVAGRLGSDPECSRTQYSSSREGRNPGLKDARSSGPWSSGQAGWRAGGERKKKIK
ncbi:unnamed protein product [Calypogeia fissa]